MHILVQNKKNKSVQWNRPTVRVLLEKKKTSGVKLEGLKAFQINSSHLQGYVSRRVNTFLIIINILNIIIWKQESQDK